MVIIMENPVGCGREKVIYKKRNNIVDRGRGT